MKTTVSLTAAAISLLFASPASASAWFQNKLDQKGIPDVSVTIMRWGALDSANPTEKKDRIIGQVASDKFKNVTLVLEGIGADQKPVRLEIATSVHNFCKDRPPYYCTISGCLRKQPSTSIGVATQGASTSGGCFFEISPRPSPDSKVCASSTFRRTGNLSTTSSNSTCRPRSHATAPKFRYRRRRSSTRPRLRSRKPSPAAQAATPARSPLNSLDRQRFSHTNLAHERTRPTHTNNWENGIIDDVITNTITAHTTLWFKRDHATGPSGLRLEMSSNSTTVRNFLLDDSGGTYTLTLNGDIKRSGTYVSPQIYLPVDLGGEIRTIDTGSPSMQWGGVITNGSIIKIGSDQLRLSTSSVYLNAPVVVNQGTLYPYQAAVNYTVPTIVNNAGLLFYGGSLLNTPTITLNAITGGATLTSQNYANGENRLGDAVDLILVSAASGNNQVAVTHQIDATANVDVAERIGRISAHHAA